MSFGPDDIRRLSHLNTEIVILQEQMMTTQCDYNNLVLQFLIDVDAGNPAVSNARVLNDMMDKQRQEVLRLGMEMNGLSKKMADAVDGSV